MEGRWWAGGGGGREREKGEEENKKVHVSNNISCIKDSVLDTIN